MKKTKQEDLKIGDSVKIVKLNKYVLNPPNFRMVGWQGRIFSIVKTYIQGFIEIEFDSITLKKTHRNYINYCKKSRRDYACFELIPGEYVKTEPRDTIEEVEAARKEIYKKFRIKSILDVKGENVWDENK